MVRVRGEKMIYALFGLKSGFEWKMWKSDVVWIKVNRVESVGKTYESLWCMWLEMYFF